MADITAQGLEAFAVKYMAVDTWLDGPTSVTLDVIFQTEPINAGLTVLEIPEEQIQVDIENSNYQKVSQ